MYIFCFLGPHLRRMEIPRLGVKLELQLRPMPQPRQRQIQATSAIYTAACGNAGSLTHWARPGIEPASSRILIGFISTELQRELLKIFFIFLIFIYLFFLLFLWAAPTAYGGSRARGRIGAVVTSLCQRHSNAGSEPRLQPTSQLTATLDH